MAISVPCSEPDVKHEEGVEVESAQERFRTLDDLERFGEEEWSQMPYCVFSDLHNVTEE